MNNKNSSYKDFDEEQSENNSEDLEKLQVKLKAQKLHIAYGEKARTLTLEEWKDPNKVEGVAKSLGVEPKTLFLCVSEALAQETIEESPPAATAVEHLSIIEDPRLAGKPVLARGIVASTSIAYQVPCIARAYIIGEEGDIEDTVELELKKHDAANLAFVGVSEDIRTKKLHRLFNVAKSTRLKVEPLAWRTVYMLRVRPPVLALEKKGETIVDERGFEYKSYDVFAVAEEPLSFTPGSEIELEAIPTASPKTGKIVLLAYSIKFPEEPKSFDMEKLRMLKKKLDEFKSVESKVDWILSEFEKYSRIIKRRNLALVSLLTYFSPLYLTFCGEVKWGWMNSVLMGDTTTGKSETLRKLIRLLKAGMLITAETASQVGLTGSATQLEKEGWFVDWGFLVLCDRKLLAIDGAQKLPPSCWASLAEAERSGVVRIAKAAKDTAYARTRQIKITNALNKEETKWMTKPLAEFLYPVQSLATVFDKTGIARLDVVAFAESADVSPEEVNKLMSEQYDPLLENLAEALRWCWSNVAQVVFDDEAVSTILTAATILYHEFHSATIPLVEIDMKWKLIRLSAALATLTLSTSDFKTIVVTREHVEYVTKFLRDEYSRVGLNSLAQEEKFEVPAREDAEKALEHIQGETGLEREKIVGVMRFILKQGRVTAEQLKKNFELSEKSELRPLTATMVSLGFLKSGKGYYPTKQLLLIFKLLDENSPRGGSFSTMARAL